MLWICLLATSILQLPLVNCNRNYLRAAPNLNQESNALVKNLLIGSQLSKPEVKQRMFVLSRSKEAVRQHNADPNRKFNMGLNKFSLMSITEKRLYLGFNNATKWTTMYSSMKLGSTNVLGSEYGTPSTYDHKKEGHVTPIKAQGSCASCWSFSAVGAFEGSYSRATGILKSFSEKEALDCSYPAAKNGCMGGWFTAAWNYVKRAGRLASMRDIPYYPEAGSCDRWVGKPNGIKNADFIGYYKASSRPADLEKVLSIYTPAVAYTVEDEFYFYKNGLYDGCATPGRVNHGGILVGYGPSYWEAKNSWGSQWGDRGFVKFSRDRDDVCRITSYVMYPVVIGRDKGEHDEPDIVPDEELVNIALQKEVISSNNEAVPQAVDGRLDTCYSTGSSNNPYFKLNLGAVSRIQRIELVTQVDAADQIIGSKVHIGDRGNFVDKRVGMITKVEEGVAVIELEQPVEGSRFYWEYYGGGQRDLTVCEIRVFAKDTKDDDGVCPAGTTLCPDGVCRHAHKC